MPDREMVKKRFIQVMERKGLPIESVTENTKFVEDLGADSLNMVELVRSVEEEFAIEIPDSDAEKLRTVGDCIDYIIQHTS